VATSRKKPVLRAKMPLAERAKQFMPFAAVKGLEEALAAVERERCAPKANPSEEPPFDSSGTVSRADFLGASEKKGGRGGRGGAAGAARGKTL